MNQPMSRAPNPAPASVIAEPASHSRRALLRAAASLGALAFLQGCATRPRDTARVIWPDQEGEPLAGRTFADHSSTEPGIRVSTTQWDGRTAAPVPGAPTPTPAPSFGAPPSYYALPQGVIPRSQWTDQGLIVSRLTANGHDGRMGRVQRITIHHDSMTSGDVRSQRSAAERMRLIRTGHISRKGEPFADIGYHFAIDPSGRVWEGRPLVYQGAHVRGQNDNNLGIVLMGNFDTQRPTPDALKTLERFVAAQMQRYSVPLSSVRTHQELAPTACPGRNLQAYLVASRTRGAMARA